MREYLPMFAGVQVPGEVHEFKNDIEYSLHSIAAKFRAVLNGTLTMEQGSPGEYSINAEFYGDGRDDHRVNVVKFQNECRETLNIVANKHGAVTIREPFIDQRQQVVIDESDSEKLVA